MPEAAPTLRSLAKQLGLSRTTVSWALSGSPRISPDTARLVIDAAEKAGYRRNPLAGSLMAELRRSRTVTMRGTLALIDMEAPDQPAAMMGFRRELIRGVTERAEKLGFQTDRFCLGAYGLTVPRLQSILQNRSIHGVVILPIWGRVDLSGLDWPQLAGVYTDYYIEHPPLKCVCCDHSRSMYTLLQNLNTLGYRRPGLFVNRMIDTRLHHRWEGAFSTYVRHREGMHAVPPLIWDSLERTEFLDWFRTHKPDVVVGHDPAVIGWMEAAGARVPETHGFACLNQHLHAVPCAGLDQQPALLGANAADIVIAQLHRNERGSPASSSMMAVPARWIDGPTVRQQPEPARISGKPAVARKKATRRS